MIGIILLLECLFLIFWLYTTSENFVKDAESEDDIDVDDAYEDHIKTREPAVDSDIAGIVGTGRK